MLGLFDDPSDAPVLAAATKNRVCFFERENEGFMVLGPLAVAEVLGIGGVAKVVITDESLAGLL